VELHIVKRSISRTLVLLGSAVAIVGCSSTVTGGYRDSPDGKYRLWMRTFGAYRHAFVEHTPKTIRISLVKIIGEKSKWNEQPLFAKEYHFACADVCVTSSWDKQDNLSLIIYEYGSGVSSSYTEKTHAESNYIATPRFILDKQTGTFHEKQ
jgi:hypothetical protein